MGVLNELFRKEVWEEYRDLEYQIRELKTIVQNEMDITEEEMHKHNLTTDRVASQLNDINLRIRNRI